MAKTKMTENKLKQDIKFLLQRSMKTSCCGFADESSNNIVAIAYGILTLKKQVLPRDLLDWSACAKMWEKLPRHRKTEKAKKAFRNAENYHRYLDKGIVGEGR